MHYAEFAEDEVRANKHVQPKSENIADHVQSQMLLKAIREYDNNKWRHIGAALGKPAKACEQYAKEHFAGQDG